jgi:hypothetical protein
MNFNASAIPTVVLAGTLFIAGMWVERRIQSRATRMVLLLLGVAAAIPGVFILLYYTHLFGNSAWFYEFRTAPYSEISMAGIGWLTGYCYSLIAPEGKGEKAAWPIALLVLVSLPFIKAVLDPINLETLRATCPDHVCLQTTYSTCGPSSAASIVLALGQEASERSLAREALTSKGGTELWYLARALRGRGFTTSYSVQPKPPVTFPAPAIAGVILRGGTGHFIGLISRDGTKLTYMDPLKGRFTVSDDELRIRYQFSGVFLLVDRKHS